MPLEILDRIASFVSGHDILQLCHAVPYYKYISKAMHDFSHAIERHIPPRPVLFWHGVKLPIHHLQFLGFSTNPTEMLDVLHRAPMLSSLHISNLEDCAATALSECKSLRTLILSNLFDGEESAEQIVRKLMDIAKDTKIQKLE
ncbi:hypothetical protein HDU78_010458, partial [Chytriomyces hyalinus]